MFNIADIVILIVLLIALFLGYKRGFVKTMFRFVSFWVALAIALCMYKPVAVYLTANTGIDDWIVTTITGKYEEENKNEIPEEISEDTTSVEDKVEEIPESDTTTSEEESIETAFNNLPATLQELIGFEDFKNQAKENISEQIVEISMNLISMVGIYVVVKLLLAIVCFIIDGIMQIPVLKQANEILGLLLGAVIGILQIYVIFAIITSLSSFIMMDTVTSYIKMSLIAKFFYDNNLLMILLF